MNHQNRLLHNNRFINTNDSINDLPSEKKEQFKTFFENKRKKELRRRVANSLEQELEQDDLLMTNAIAGKHGKRNADGSISEVLDTATILMSQLIPDQFMPLDQQMSKGLTGTAGPRKESRYSGTVSSSIEDSRTKRVRRTVYNVDSRDRDDENYPNANTFKLDLDRDYINIEKVELVSTEFPNTDRVIKGSPSALQNNKIVWINQEDSGLPVPFPEYSVELTSGNYTVSTLTDEMQTKMNLVKRSTAGGNKNHYFDIDINLDTDIVEIHSLNLTGLTDNSIVTTADSNLINVFVQETLGTATPTWAVGDKFFLLGVKGFTGGISPRLLNGFHTVTQTTLDNGSGSEGVISINENNFVIDFDESSGGGGGTIGFAALTKQVYSTPAALATEIATKMTAASTNSTTYTVDFDSTVANRFTIAGSASFELLFSSGTNSATSTAPAIGFSAADTGAGTSHSGTSDLVNNTIQFEVSLPAVFSDVAGGNGVRAGNVLPFKFLFGQGTDFTNNNFSSNTIAGVLGYPEEDSSEDLPGTDQLTTISVGIEDVTIGSNTLIETSTVHNLLAGDKIKISGLVTVPSILRTTDAVFTVLSVPTTTTFTIDFETISVNSISFPFAKVSSNKVTVSHTSHSLVTGDIVTIYRAETTGGILSKVLNGTARTITVVDANTYTFGTEDIFATSQETGGGSLIRVSAHFNTATNTISNTLYGFNGLQDNTSDGTNLNRSVNLDGENYVLLTSPQLGTFSTSGLVNAARKVKVENVFAKLLLQGAPGTIIFSSFISSPKIFDSVPLALLNQLEFTIKRQDNNNYDFFGFDYSFAIEITELVDEIQASGFSSRRGVKEVVDQK